MGLNVLTKFSYINDVALFNCHVLKTSNVFFIFDLTTSTIKYITKDHLVFSTLLI